MENNTITQEVQDSATPLEADTAPTGKLTAQVQKYGLPGEDYQSLVTHGASTSLSLTDYRLCYQPPSQVTLSQCQGKLDSNTFGSYAIYGETTNNPGVSVLLYENLTDFSGDLDLTAFVAEGDRLDSITLCCGASCEDLDDQGWLWVKGTINQDCAMDSTLSSTCYLTAESQGGDLNETLVTTSLVEATSRLELEAEFVDPPTTCQAGDLLTVKFTIPEGNDLVRDPTFLCLLPDSLTDGGELYFLLHQGYFDRSYDSREEDFPYPLPTVEFLSDYHDIGSTLLRCQWEDTVVGFQDSLEMYCTFEVTTEAEGEVLLAGILGNPGDDTTVVGEIYDDEYDLDEDMVLNENLVISEEISCAVAEESPVSMSKTVRGDLDTGYQTEGYATPGGEATYRLVLTNTQSSDLTAVEIVDILPFVGDTAVLDSSVPRGSEYNIFPTGEVSATIFSLNSMETQAMSVDTRLTVEYSTSHDPIRFDATGTGTIGVGTWSTTPPSNISLLASVKVTLNPGEVLERNQILYVLIPVKTPVGAPVGTVSYNSFASLVSLDGVQKTPEETNTASLTIATSAKATVGQFVWEDENGDGLYSPGEPGVNGVTVLLYDESGNLLKETITCDHMSGEPGYYCFNGLEPGDYQVQFLPPTGYGLTQQNLSSDLGSRPDPDTGFAPVFTLAEGESNLLQNAGLLAEVPDPSLAQAISDVIASVAMEEAGLAHILDGEGLKIQKAVSLNLTASQLIAVNDSVESMVETISALETVLQEKIVTVLGQ